MVEFPDDDGTLEAGVAPDQRAAGPDEGGVALREQLVAVMRADFGKFSDKVFGLRDRQRTDPMSFAYSYGLIDLSFDEEGQFVWYDGREGYGPEVPIGSPKDYLAIREDYGELVEFVGKTLDRGRVHAGVGGHGDSTRETNCADYISWLHRNNENQAFRQNLERAVAELLDRELRREFIPLDFDSEYAREASHYRPPYFTGLCDVEEALRRIGLGSNVKGDDDKQFRDLFVTEMRKTERPITEDEYVEIFHGSVADKVRDYESGRPAQRYKVVHFEETSPEFQVALKNWCVKKRAMKAAVIEFSPQFNRLVGLLDVVAVIGEHDPRFLPLYSLLKGKAEERFMIGSPAIAHHYSATDVYRSVLIALSAVQQGNELEQFWLENVENDPDAQRVIASIHGLLMTHEDQETRRRQIPSLLARLKQRKFDMDEGYERFDGIGFCFHENFLNDVLRHIAALCYAGNTFCHLDRESGTLDFLQGKDVKVGSYDFRFARFKPEGASELSASFDLAEDSVTGSTELESSIRASIDRDGYELPNGVSVTSLEGRKITGGDAKIVDAGEVNVDGLYEGLIGLNHSHFAFLYDADSGRVLLVEPSDKKTTMFGVRGGWQERRKGLDKVESRIPHACFEDLTAVGGKVNVLVAERRRGGYLGDSLYGLEGKLSDGIAEHLRAVIHGRLVKNGDGLILG